jgi:hypothetical protein
MKRQDLRNLIKENISDWLSERATLEALQAEESPIKEEKSTFEDKISKDGNIYLVYKPGKDDDDSEIVDMISVETLIGKGYIGAYLTKEKALAAGKKALKARDAQMKETYKKGQDKLKEMEGSLDEIKAEIEKNMAEATANPTMRETMQTKSNSLLEKLTQVEAMIERLRGGLEKEGLRLEKKKPSKDKKEDSKKDEKADDKKDDK